MQKKIIKITFSFKIENWLLVLKVLFHLNMSEYWHRPTWDYWCVCCSKLGQNMCLFHLIGCPNVLRKIKIILHLLVPRDTSLHKCLGSFNIQNFNKEWGTKWKKRLTWVRTGLDTKQLFFHGAIQGTTPHLPEITLIHLTRTLCPYLYQCLSIFLILACLFLIFWPQLT